LEKKSRYKWKIAAGDGWSVRRLSLGAGPRALSVPGHCPHPEHNRYVRSVSVIRDNPSQTKTEHIPLNAKKKSSGDTYTGILHFTRGNYTPIFYTTKSSVLYGLVAHFYYRLNAEIGSFNTGHRT
jgi:hypothetical protein